MNQELTARIKTTGGIESSDGSGTVRLMLNKAYEQ